MGMAIKNPVIVMALFDIGRDKWNSFTLSYNTYLYWMKNSLSLDANIVIYTEEKFVDTITRYRQEFDHNFDKTIIITKNIEDLDCYKTYYESLASLMFSNEFKKKIQTSVPEMDQPLYNIVMFNKLFFLKDVKDNNYFNNDMLIWADAGGLRESIHNYQKQQWPSLKKINQLDNSKATFFSHSKNINILDPEYHALSQIRYIQGTCFFVPSIILDDLVEKFTNTIDICIKNKYIGSDEKIFDITYSNNTVKHNLIKCDWRTYFKIFKDDDSDLFQESSAEKKKIFIDIGSHSCSSIRDHINQLKIDETWDIYAFEPNQDVDTKSISETLPFDVKVQKKAVWTRTGKCIINRYGDDGLGQGSLLEETEEGRSYTDYYDSKIVECIDILDIVKEFDKNQEIYIYIDAEYSEYAILTRLISHINNANIRLISVEWHGSSKPEYEHKINELHKKIITKNITLISKKV